MTLRANIGGGLCSAMHLHVLHVRADAAECCSAAGAAERICGRPLPPVSCWVCVVDPTRACLPQVRNFGNDVVLAEACRKDVEQFCSEVLPGDGRVHECLRKRRPQLSERCAKEELRLEIQESKNFDLRPSLKKVRRDSPARAISAPTLHPDTPAHRLARLVQCPR